MVRGDAVSERYEVETTREGFKVTIRGAEVCHVEAFGSDAQSQIDAAVKANLIRAALNATEAGRELVVLVVRLIETNGSDYSAWQGIKRWLESNPIPEPSAG